MLRTLIYQILINSLQFPLKQCKTTKINQKLYTCTFIYIFLLFSFPLLQVSYCYQEKMTYERVKTKKIIVHNQYYVSIKLNLISLAKEKEGVTTAHKRYKIYD